jgi:Na+(H+)/acetate symporter ActP
MIVLRTFTDIIYFLGVWILSWMAFVFVYSFIGINRMITWKEPLEALLSLFLSLLIAIFVLKKIGRGEPKKKNTQTDVTSTIVQISEAGNAEEPKPPVSRTRNSDGTFRYADPSKEPSDQEDSQRK